MSGALRKALDLFLFTSLFISGCAVLMAWQTYDLLHIAPSGNYLVFVFFSTLCSYNFHWYLTPDDPVQESRVQWTQQHKTLHLTLFLTGLAGAGFFGFLLIGHIHWMIPAGVLTFLYSAPKISMAPFNQLRKVAVGKTIYLSFVWMYVTTALPVLIASNGLNKTEWLFCISRFFLIYPICIIFDYRDRVNDRIAGIRSMITYFSEKGIDNLFYLSSLIFFISTVSLYYAGFLPLTIVLLLIPGFITIFLYRRAKREFSDYLYYFVLDGLMMFSAIFTALL